MIGEAKNEQMQIGKYRVYHNDYDGDWFVIVDDQTARGYKIREKDLEAAIERLADIK